MSDFKRIETGPLQVGDDWPGIFIRGDHAAHYVMSLRTALYTSDIDPTTKRALQSLCETLESCNVMQGAEEVTLLVPTTEEQVMWRIEQGRRMREC